LLEGSKLSLEPSYLDYPKRRKGYDHDLFPWSPIRERKPVNWPDGKSVAIWICVSLEWFPITPEDTPFRAPGHMQTAYPDYRHYTAREYGTRIGFYRLLDAFKKAGLKVSVAVNSAIAERYPQIVEDIMADGHEIIAHSTDMNGTITSDLPIEAERAIITRSVETLTKASGKKIHGWLSIARSQSWNTPHLLKEAGITYSCDWVNDELPYRFDTGLINLPLNHELADRQIITVQQQSADSYAASMLDAYEWLLTEADQWGGRMLPMHITPYIMGLPYRIGALEKLLAILSTKRGAWFASGGDIVESWAKQNSE
jgi:allantoinase